jgi:alcohol dehydrogenase YqhD (iron-dependent ADH family)
MDALTHAVEAYIGKSNVKSTEEYAEKATKMIFENIETAYKDGKNIEARDQMLKVESFKLLVEVLPQNAREWDDNLYKVIDIYLKVILLLYIISKV